MHEVLAPFGDIPPDLENVGRVMGAWGLQGEIKVKPYSPEASALLQGKRWWLEQRSTYSGFEVASAKMHSGSVLAKLNGIADRDRAEDLKGREIWVSRRDFPALAKDEYYWVELIGLQVVDLAGKYLGRVSDLSENGAHASLEVRQDADGKNKTFLIPFVGLYVKTIERAAGQIIVDWDENY